MDAALGDQLSGHDSMVSTASELDAELADLDIEQAEQEEERTGCITDMVRHCSSSSFFCFSAFFSSLAAFSAASFSCCFFLCLFYVVESSVCMLVGVTSCVYVGVRTI